MIFLQTKTWEKFQQSLGRTTAWVEDIFLVKNETFLGSYWYSPRPTLTQEKLVKIKDWAASEVALFTRFDPDQGFEAELPMPWARTIASQPEHTVVLDISPSEEDLLGSFHKKTRYNIGLAEKKGVIISNSSDPNSKELLAFLELSKGTGNRQDFRYHPAGYYRSLVTELNSDSYELEVIAAWQGDLRLAAVVVLYDKAEKIAYYLHGASDYTHRSLMAPHLLQWTAIKRAKSLDLSKYDFWGIAPLNQEREILDEHHPWAGVTRFKLGFGGEIVNYPESFDLINNKSQYQLYKLARSFRRKLPI